MDDRKEGTMDKAKGKVKEAAGELTGDDRLEREGKEDQLEGAGKQAVGHVKEAGRDVKEAIEDATD
jgi:uncharacterized protein YjbJ (UPF0337 family)